MLKLVIVEDEVNIRECLEHLFPWENIGISVVKSFANGNDAYKYILSNPVDILLTDIRLPTISGLELIAMLRESQYNLPVVVLTAFKQFDYAQQAVKLHVHDFLLKPIKYEDLVSAMIAIKEDLSENNTGETFLEDNTYHERIVSAAMRFVNDHISTATLESTALNVNLSQTYLSKLFHKVANTTFSDYLFGCRMKKAAELLGNTACKTYEIALMVGYDNPKNFSRAFKQYYSVSPREYRDNLSIIEQECL